MSIDWFTFFAQIVNFLIVLVLLRRFLYRPVIDVMTKRNTEITAEFTEAEELAQKARNDTAQYRSALAKLESEREAYLSDAALEATEQRKAMVSQTRDEIENMRLNWYEAVEQEKHKFLLEVRTRMGDTVHDLTRDALSDLAGADLEGAIVTKFLEKIRDLKTDERSVTHKNIQIGEPGVPIIVRSSFGLSPEQQSLLQSEIATMTNNTGPDTDIGLQFTFERSPDLICGIDVQLQDRRIAWSIRDYLDSYAKQLDAALNTDIRNEAIIA